MPEIITEYAVPAIMAAVYLILLMAKPLFGNKTKWIPLTAGLLGVGLNAWLNMSFGHRGDTGRHGIEHILLILSCGRDCDGPDKDREEI